MLLSYILNSTVVLSLLGIAMQDIKERKVAVWLFVVSGLLLGILHIKEVYIDQFLLTTFINICIELILITVLFLYAKIVLKTAFKQAFGLGDFFFFILLAIGFPTATFLVLFSFSLVFSLALFLILKKNSKFLTVPLAGLQALFLCLVFIANWVFHFSNLYL